MAEYAFPDFRDAGGFIPAHLITVAGCRCSGLLDRLTGGGKAIVRMENDMTSKLTAIVAAAAVLASAGVASAQTNRNGRVQWQAPYTNSYYYNYDTRNLRYGHANDFQFDSYAGTR